MAPPVEILGANFLMYQLYSELGNVMTRNPSPKQVREITVSSQLKDFSKILPRSVFLFLKNNNNCGGEEFYRVQLKKGYSLDEVEDRILDLREKEKERIADHKESWMKLKRHMGER